MADDRIRIIVEPDTSGFGQELNSDLSRVDSSFDVNVHADTTAAAVAIKRWETKEQSNPVEKPVTVDTTRARNMLKTFSAQAATPIHKLVNMDTTGAQKSLRSLGSVGSKAFGTIGAAAKASGVGALLLLGTAAMAGKDELIEMNAVSSQTTAQLKLSGLAAKITTKDIENLSGALLEKSGIDDQAIQAGANFILQQKAIQDTIRKTPEFLNRATEAATNLASSPAFKGNMAAASKTLALALADPEKGMKKLAKAGVDFTTSEKDRIKALVEGGKAAEAQALILSKVEKSTGGLAEARGKSVQGMLDKLSEAFAGAGAGILSKLLPTLVKIGGAFGKAFSDDGVITRFLGALKPLGRVIAVIGSSFAIAFGGVGEGTDIIGSLGKAMESLAGFVEQNQDSIIAFALVIKDLVVAAGGLIKTLGPVLFPVLKMFGVLAAGLVIELAKVETVIAKVYTAILSWLPTFNQAGAAIAGFIAAVVLGFQNFWARTVEIFTGLVAWMQALPGKIMSGLRSFGAMVTGFFSRVWNRVVLTSKTIIGGFIAYVRAIPARVLGALASLGLLLATFIKNVWNRFRSITVGAIMAYITLVRGIPGRIVAAIGSVATLLTEKGKEVFAGFKAGLVAGFAKVEKWLKGIGTRIKELKGPIEVDRVLLVDEGAAIMDGFGKGLKSKWDGVEGWLSERGGFISGLLSKVGLGKVTDSLAGLFAGEVSLGEVQGFIDKESSGGLHPSSGLADTMLMERILNKMFGIIGTTFKAGHSKYTASGNVSQHFTGHAVDFGDSVNPHALLDKVATWTSMLIDKVFRQVIWRNRFWEHGKKTGSIDGHKDHLHLGWIPRRSGGGVRPSANYMVGEDGPEGFVPNSSGFILNNTRLDRMLNVDRRLGTLEHGVRGGRSATGAAVQQHVTINMPEIRAADGQGWAMMTTNRLLEMLKANAVSMVGGVA